MQKTYSNDLCFFRKKHCNSACAKSSEISVRSLHCPHMDMAHSDFAEYSKYTYIVIFGAGGYLVLQRVALKPNCRDIMLIIEYTYTLPILACFTMYSSIKHFDYLSVYLSYAVLKKRCISFLETETPNFDYKIRKPIFIDE